MSKASPAFKLVYRCDATPSIGFGHVKRGIDLVEALRERTSVDVHFIGSYTDRARSFLESRLGREAVSEGAIEPPTDEDLRRGLGRLQPDLAVVDLLDRDTDSKFMRMLRETSGRTVAITDDSYKRVIDADLIINCNPSQEPAWYPDPHRYKLGLRYFLADPALTDGPRRANVPLEGRKARILLAFGGHDLKDGKLQVVRFLDGLRSRLHLDILITPVSPPEEDLLACLSAGRWEADVHRQLSPRALTALFTKADLVICSMGNLGYEALVMGCPVIAVNQVPRQAEIAAWLSAKGAVVNLGMADGLDQARLCKAVTRLLDSEEECGRMGEAGRNLCDGRGVSRVADLIVELLNRQPAHVGSSQ